MVAHTSDLNFNRCPISSANSKHKPSWDSNTLAKGAARSSGSLLCVHYPLLADADSPSSWDFLMWTETRFQLKRLYT